MKRILLFSTVAISTLLSSCFKDEVEPVSDKNSKVVLTGTKYHNLILADSVFQSLAMTFLVRKSDTTLPPDTIEASQRYLVTDPNDTRTFYFNTPVNTISASFIVRGEVYGAFCDSVTIDNFSYQKDGQTLISQPLPLMGSGITFVSTPVTYHF